MTKPDADTIVADARKLKDDRFSKRDSMLVRRRNERFNIMSDKQWQEQVPVAYRKTAHQHDSSIIEDEGRQIGTLVYAVPVPHLPPPTPEDQPATTTAEKFLMAWFAETEACFGPIWWQETLAQVHDNIAYEYVGWRRKPYAGQPAPPEDETDMNAVMDYADQNNRFKMDAGVRSYCDRRYVPTGTAFPIGNVFDPDRFYEIKEVAERDLMAAYNVTKNSDGSYSKASDKPSSTPSGRPENANMTETMVTVIEYWDRDWCVIVAETRKEKWLGTRTVREGFLLEEWEHKWGRVPYFARPAFVTDQLDEDKKFAGPLDAIYTEMPSHKKLCVMSYSVAYQTAFSPLQINTKETGDLILDENGKQVTFLELQPGQARQLAPGQSINVIPQSPEVANLFQEKAASQARIEHYSLSPVSKGVAPGADTANAALSNLHRFQLSTLDPMAQQASRQASAIYRFVLERVKEMKERCYVFDSKTDSYLSLSADEIVSVNVQAKVTPDQGQFRLLLEKHAMELWLSRAISKIDMYEMMGYENPEEKAVSVEIEDYSNTLKPIVLQQVTSTLGMLDSTNAMLQENAQSGSAKNAIPGLMDQARGMQEGQTPTGMGSGSPEQPRTPGVRMSPLDVNTQKAATGGY